MKLPPGHVAGKGVVRPTGYGGFGERLLRGMGWEAGQGLGKTGDGIKEAIQVTKKEDTVGVSAWAATFATAAAASGDAAADTGAFAAVQLECHRHHACDSLGPPLMLAPASLL